VPGHPVEDPVEPEDVEGVLGSSAHLPRSRPPVGRSSRAPVGS
jgi:hypothetical protein